MNLPDIQTLVALSSRAAASVLAVYREPAIAVHTKPDQSPLTRADLASHAIICDGLQQTWPEIPVISEESTAFHAYETRAAWETFFLVDPLDGTKEFVNRNDEFTINIALVHQGLPVMGVIHVPALDVIYYAGRDQGAYKIFNNQRVRLSPRVSEKNDRVTVAVSRSHFCEKTDYFIQQLKDEGKEVVTVSAGSALKFGLVAEGIADMYPRFTPTMEWDTAAGQVLVNEAGKKVIVAGTDRELQYNKPDLRNAGFVVK